MNSNNHNTKDINNSNNNIDSFEILFWKVFKNKYLSTKILSFLSLDCISNNGISQDSIEYLIDNKRIIMLKHKIINNHYLKFSDTSLIKLLNTIKNNSAGGNNSIGDGISNKELFQSYFSKYKNYLVYSYDHYFQLIIKSNNLEALQVFYEIFLGDTKVDKVRYFINKIIFGKSIQLFRYKIALWIVELDNQQKEFKKSILNDYISNLNISKDSTCGINGDGNVGNIGNIGNDGIELVKQKYLEKIEEEEYFEELDLPLHLKIVNNSLDLKNNYKLFNISQNFYYLSSTVPDNTNQNSKGNGNVLPISKTMMWVLFFHSLYHSVSLDDSINYENKLKSQICKIVFALMKDENIKLRLSDSQQFIHNVMGSWNRSLIPLFYGCPFEESFTVQQLINLCKLSLLIEYELDYPYVLTLDQINSIEMENKSLNQLKKFVSTIDPSNIGVKSLVRMFISLSKLVSHVNKPSKHYYFKYGIDEFQQSCEFDLSFLNSIHYGSSNLFKKWLEGYSKNIKSNSKLIKSLLIDFEKNYSDNYSDLVLNFNKNQLSNRNCDNSCNNSNQINENSNNNIEQKSKIVNRKHQNKKKYNKEKYQHSESEEEESEEEYETLSKLKTKKNNIGKDESSKYNSNNNQKSVTNNINNIINNRINSNNNKELILFKYCNYLNFKDKCQFIKNIINYITNENVQGLYKIDFYYIILNLVILYNDVELIKFSIKIIYPLLKINSSNNTINGLDNLFKYIGSMQVFDTIYEYAKKDKKCDPTIWCFNGRIDLLNRYEQLLGKNRLPIKIKSVIEISSVAQFELYLISYSYILKNQDKYEISSTIKNYNKRIFSIPLYSVHSKESFDRIIYISEKSDIKLNAMAFSDSKRINKFTINYFKWYLQRIHFNQDLNIRQFESEPLKAILYFTGSWESLFKSYSQDNFALFFKNSNLWLSNAAKNRDLEILKMIIQYFSNDIKAIVSEAHERLNSSTQTLKKLIVKFLKYDLNAIKYLNSNYPELLESLALDKIVDKALKNNQFDYIFYLLNNYSKFKFSSSSSPNQFLDNSTITFLINKSLVK